MNQSSPEEMFICVQASLHNSPGGQHDDLQSSNWKLTPESASYKGKKLDVGGVHFKLLCRFVEANGEPVKFDDLKIACDHELLEDGSLSGYISKLRKKIRHALNLPKTPDPITCKDGTYRLNLD